MKKERKAQAGILTTIIIILISLAAVAATGVFIFNSSERNLHGL